MDKINSVLSPAVQSSNAVRIIQSIQPWMTWLGRVLGTSLVTKWVTHTGTGGCCGTCKKYDKSCAVQCGKNKQNK